jgi:hypothetical protein
VQRSHLRSLTVVNAQSGGSGSSATRSCRGALKRLPSDPASTRAKTRTLADTPFPGHSGPHRSLSQNWPTDQVTHIPRLSTISLQ